MLDSSIATDHQGQIFCKTCYARKFGPKGYGFGGGGGCLNVDKVLERDQKLSSMEERAGDCILKKGLNSETLHSKYADVKK